MAVAVLQCSTEARGLAGGRAASADTELPMRRRAGGELLFPCQARASRASDGLLMLALGQPELR